MLPHTIDTIIQGGAEKGFTLSPEELQPALVDVPDLTYLGSPSL